MLIYFRDFFYVLTKTFSKQELFQCFIVCLIFCICFEVVLCYYFILERFEAHVNFIYVSMKRLLIFIIIFFRILIPFVANNLTHPISPSFPSKTVSGKRGRDGEQPDHLRPSGQH